MKGDASQKLWARFPLARNCMGQDRFMDIWINDGEMTAADLKEIQPWIETVGRPLATWNERQAHRAVALGLEGIAAALLREPIGEFPG